MKRLAILLLILLTAQCSQGNRSVQEKHGLSLFVENCSVCHGKNAAGQDPNYPEGRWLDNGENLAPALNEKGHVWIYSPELTFQKIKTGLLDTESPMPPFHNKMSDQEIILVIQHIVSLWPVDIKQSYTARYKDSNIVNEI
jgi:mono/diheme cytochrome c family protein